MRCCGGRLIRTESCFGFFPFDSESIESALVEDVFATLGADKHETTLEKRRVDVRRSVRWAGWSDLFVPARLDTRPGEKRKLTGVACGHVVESGKNLVRQSRNDRHQ